MTIINNTKRGEKEQNVRMEKVNCVTIPLVLYSFKETEEDFLHMFLFLNKDTLILFISWSSRVSNGKK